MLFIKSAISKFIGNDVPEERRGAVINQGFESPKE